MKTRIRSFALVLATAAVLAAPLTAIQNAEDVSLGERFRRPNVSIDTETRLPDGGMLLKGVPVDVDIESLGAGKVKATFFQGGARKGEANGMIIVASRPARRAGQGPDGKGSLKLADLGLDANAPASFVKGAGKIDFVVGNPGANQILIGLLLPAVPVNPAAAPVQPRKADPPGEAKGDAKGEVR